MKIKEIIRRVLILIVFSYLIIYLYNSFIELSFIWDKQAVICLFMFFSAFYCLIIYKEDY